MRFSVLFVFRRTTGSLAFCCFGARFRANRRLTEDIIMSPKTTAIVLIEYQNDFATEGGIFHNAVKEVMGTNRMLPNTVKVVTEAREAGATIVHVPISFSGDY